MRKRGTFLVTYCDLVTPYGGDRIISSSLHVMKQYWLSIGHYETNVSEIYINQNHQIVKMY